MAQGFGLTTPLNTRNTAVDAYRGFVMFLMMAEVLRLSSVAAAHPESWFWSILAFHQTHVEWAGCSLHDLIQPGFSFLVGVALPYSIANRMAKGATAGRLFAHALWRALLLVMLGVFLRSTHAAQTYFTFEDTLSQIGLGYPLLFLLGLRAPRWQWISLGAILGGYWLAWSLYPAAAAQFDWPSVGVSAEWHREHNFQGIGAHWNKNANFGNSFDQWFLNLFPRERPFVYNDGGYLTLSFLPTLGTMVLGLAAGRWLRAAAPVIPIQRFLIAGGAGVLSGLLLHFTGVCPVVKRIWTPSWTLFSGGACFLMLVAFCAVIEMKGRKQWAFPLVVIGMNSIAAYLIAHLLPDFITDSFRIHLGPRAFELVGVGLEPFVQGLVILLVYWLILYWMYRRKLFLKI